jgi:hypothetical protein
VQRVMHTLSHVCLALVLVCRIAVMLCALHCESSVEGLPDTDPCSTLSGRQPCLGCAAVLFSDT